jgi:serine phosphatase RsbU (regulator of sigma subunit)
MVTALTVLLALAGAVTVLRSHRLEHTRRRLVEDVGLLQAALLPALPERVGAACVSAAYLPAEGVAAGGDFFDAFELGDGRTCVIVGDVAGHGRESVPLTAHVHYTLRAYLEAGLSPREALHVGATALGPHLGERTVTAVVGIYDPVTGGLTYACAGHPPPVVTGREHEPVTACSSPPLAAGLAPVSARPRSRCRRAARRASSPMA